MTRTHVSPPQRATALTLELCLLSALVAFSTYVAHSDLLRDQPVLIASAVAFDLTLTAALCHWLLGIRLAGLKPWTTVPVVLAGLGICGVILPKELTSGGTLPIAAIALVEASALMYATLRFRRILHSFRAAKQAGAETFDALETSFLSVAPRLPLLAAWGRLEIQLWTLFLVGWTFKRQPKDDPDVFTHHKQSHWLAILGVIAFLLLTEAGVAHLWLHTTGHTTAKWVVLAVHAYCLVWLVGDAQAARIYRSGLQRKQGQWFLSIRVGIRGSAEIPLAGIAEIATGSWNEASQDEALLTLQGTANVQIKLTDPISVRQTLRAPKTVRTILVHLDDPERFKQALGPAQVAPAVPNRP